MKILLVMPYMDFDDTKYLGSGDSAFPIGLGYIASVLEKSGHDVKVFDFQIRTNTLVEFDRVLRQGYDIVGFSVTTVTKKNTLRLVFRCRQALPEAKIIVGGAYPTVYPKDLLENSEDIDFEVTGEGEITIKELMEAIDSGTDTCAVRGIVYRGGNGLVQTEQRPLIAPLDSIDFPAHHLFQLDSYVPPPGMFFRLPLRHMITSRGCPFKCIFCDDRIIWRGKCRLRSATNIVDEMLLLKDRYGAKEIHFYDDTFTVSKDRVYRLCELIRERRVGTIWRCSSRVDTVDENMLKTMYAAGCRSISYGIESGDDEILKKMGKETTVQQAKDAVRWTNKAKIQAKGFFMLNFPGDTIETTEKTIALAKELELDFVGFNLTIPHHGDRLRKLIEGTYKINENVYYDDTSRLGNEIYFFQPSLPAEYLKATYSRVAREFYLRPRYIIKMLLSIRNMEMLKSYILGLIRVFKIRV